jgi:RNA polymerase sigma-70 factor (ECF subfamily)
VDVTQGQPASPDPGDVLLHLYEIALPQVYGYLLSRCRSRPLAAAPSTTSFATGAAGSARRA